MNMPGEWHVYGNFAPQARSEVPGGVFHDPAHSEGIVHRTPVSPGAYF